MSKPKDNLVLGKSISRVIEEMEFIFKSEAFLHNVKLKINYSFSEGFPGVMGEITGLKQVFLNIAKNAVEAVSDKDASEGGRLDISLHYDDSYAWVSFEDNGPGISPEYLSIIQRPFFTTKKKGTGLGLSISLPLLKNGGELRSTSPAEDCSPCSFAVTQNDKRIIFLL